jgi:hypothetical protein
VLEALDRFFRWPFRGASDSPDRLKFAVSQAVSYRWGTSAERLAAFWRDEVARDRLQHHESRALRVRRRRS